MALAAFVVFMAWAAIAMLVTFAVLAFCIIVVYAAVFPPLFGAFKNVGAALIGSIVMGSVIVYGVARA